MKISLAHILMSIQMFEACAELIFRRLMEGQSFSLSCSPQRDPRGPAGVYLYHRSAHSQTTLLSMADGGQCSDTGLYMWELNYKWENQSDHTTLCPLMVFVLVEGAGKTCRCSSSYRPLLMTISTAAGLLLLIITWMAIDKCVKARRHSRPQPLAPIYEEMSCKQQTPGRAQNNHEIPPHLEEVHFPVYANPNRPQQDNYYACPRQLGHNC